MNFTIQEPKTEKIGRGETKTTHPAFGQVSASRVSGRVNLYGSDFSHNDYVTLSISGSELHRSLSNDWHFARRSIIEIALSEAQWATLVSSLNVGDGVPCTLMWREGEGFVPRLPDPESRSEQFSKEMQEDFDEAVTALEELKEKIKNMGLSQKRAGELLKQVDLVGRKITSSAPFIADQFSEHMETEVERAKVEIHGYATNLFQRAGVEAIAGMPIVALPDESEKAVDG